MKNFQDKFIKSLINLIKLAVIYIIWTTIQTVAIMWFESPKWHNSNIAYAIVTIIMICVAIASWVYIFKYILKDTPKARKIVYICIGIIILTIIIHWSIPVAPNILDVVYAMLLKILPVIYWITFLAIIFSPFLEKDNI